MTDYCNKEILLQSLVICITFYYDPERITYLRTIIHHYIGIASKTHIYIVTNTSNYKYIELSLVDLPDNIFFEFITPSGIGHPFLLTWTHREILRSVATSGKASHFLYTEDDLLLGYSNILPSCSKFTYPVKP